MAEDHKHPNYFAIWGWLALLTVVEVVIALAPHWFRESESYGMVFKAVVGGLIGLALVKALLVALYFMHLRFERPTFVLIVSFPVVLAVFLVFMLFPDVAFQG